MALFAVQPCPMPDGALLGRYAREGAFTDCYATEINRAVSQAQYVTAFYTTAVFKLERQILKWAVSRPSTDAQAAQLAAGAIEEFAAWRVEERTTNQMLLADLRGRTRSWLMAVPLDSGDGPRTRLYFGSAVIPVPGTAGREPRMGAVFQALLGFHKLYSKMLLQAAKTRLENRRINEQRTN